jgi:Arc/MetJ-type ribon-helix-helix transcriptional regulator
MASVEYVTVKIPRIIASEFIDPKVKSGKYSSRSEVIKSALREFFEKYPETKLNTTIQGV